MLQWVSHHHESVSRGACPVVVWGQSAGASHVASWLFDDAAGGSTSKPVDAVMLMSRNPESINVDDWLASIAA